MKRTKIICTVGPTSGSIKTLTEMVEAGMNVARLNFSHGDYDAHQEYINNIRKVSAKTGKPLAIIQDLHGPKIRVGIMKQPLTVKIGQEVILGEQVPMDAEVLKSIRAGQHILIEDGLIELEAQRTSPGKVHCIALSAGKIQSKKGINLPRTKLRIPIFTEKDLEDLKFGLKNDVDYVALSFVRNRQDVVRLKNYIKKFNPKGNTPPKIIAKIEKPEAVADFDSILKEADAIMVARGDLGVEMPESQVPIIQKTIIQKCLRAAKPVIVATQMLDSMIRNPRPTRAEVSDVANAVIDQADCVMLSGETAFGRYPVKTVQQMARIIETTEKSPFIPGHKHILDKVVSRTEAMSESIFDLAMHTKARVIVGATMSGFTAREIAHERPPFTRIVMLTPNPKVLRQMVLIWGITAFYAPLVNNYEQLIQIMIDTVKKEKIVRKGEQLIIASGEPLGQKENLNLVEVKTA